jgi:pullulanase/glycogen debranching enzyme
MRSFLKIVIAFFFFSPLPGLAQNAQFIEWSPVKRLTWDDYLAKPSSSTDAAAITSTALGIEYHLKNNALTYTITCRFSKNNSWGRHKTEYILQHEQGHFDITELFARKLAKELREYKFDPHKYQDDVGKIYKKLMYEKEEYQNKYDKETDFSRNKEQQAEWLEKIRDELDELDEYANYGSSINV